MATFVLVHGSRHGGWCWKRVAQALRLEGHDVYCPTLSGTGDRGHLIDCVSINLDTHVEDVAALLFYEDLREVILVGHSYGGMVITGVADRSNRIARLVYLDALVPYANESHLELAGDLAGPLRAQIAGEGRGTRLPATCVDPEHYDVVDPDDRNWVAERLTDQPAATYQQRLRSATRAFELPRTFVRCRDSTLIAAFVIERAIADPDFAVTEIDAGHDAMITAPRLVVEQLLATVDASPSRPR